MRRRFGPRAAQVATATAADPVVVGPHAAADRCLRLKFEGPILVNLYTRGTVPPHRYRP
jgi:hypothetical protein